MAEQTITLPAAIYDSEGDGGNKVWNFPGGQRIAVDAALRGSNTAFFDLLRIGTAGDVQLHFERAISGAPDTANLSTDFAANGGFTLVVGGSTLTCLLDGADTTEPYIWVPANSSEVTALVASLSNTDGSTGAALTLFDAEPTANVAPSFVDDTGDAISGTVNAAITSVTVPAASGTPTPTYAVVGSLPDGIDFDTGTRVISGTPSSTGSGTIRIRATNSEGSADWTASYSFTATGTMAGPVATNRVTFQMLAPDGTSLVNGPEPRLEYNRGNSPASPSGYLTPQGMGVFASVTPTNAAGDAATVSRQRTNPIGAATDDPGPPILRRAALTTQETSFGTIQRTIQLTFWRNAAGGGATSTRARIFAEGTEQLVISRTLSTIAQPQTTGVYLWNININSVPQASSYTLSVTLFNASGESDSVEISTA